MKEKRILDNLANYLVKICEAISVGLLVVLVVCTIMQVFCRFILHSALVWSEEVSRFAGIWMVILSTSIAIQKRSHMTIDLLIVHLPNVVVRILKAVSDLIILFVCVCMLLFGNVMVSKFTGTPAPATHISMSVIYAGVSVGWVCNTIIALIEFVNSVREIPGHETAEEGGRAI